MWKIKIQYLVLILWFESVRSDKYSRDGEKRSSRFLSFDTLVDGDISVDLDFSIPFVKIPIKKAIESYDSNLMFPTINVNLVGVALGGIIILGSAVLLPYILKTYTGHEPFKRYGKILENTDLHNIDEILKLGRKFLLNPNSLEECILKFACLTTQQASTTSAAVLLDNILNNKLASKLMNTTAIETVLNDARRGRTCDQVCPVGDQSLKLLLRNIAELNT